MEFKNVVVVINGGLGKVLCASAALRGLRKKYPDKKIILLSGWSFIFENNPNVDRVYRFDENKYMYEDFVKDNLILANNPYVNNEYRLNKIHLAEAFCKVFDVEYDGNPIPELYIPTQFVNNAIKDMQKLRQKGLPIIVTQPLGATGIINGKINKTGRENLKLFDELLSQNQNKALFLLMKTTKQPDIGKGDNILKLQSDIHILQWAAYIALADGFFGVDSSGHHLAASVKKPSLVVYGRTDPKNLSYENETILFNENSDCLYCNGFDAIPVKFKCNKNFKCMDIDYYKANEILNKYIDECKKRMHKINKENNNINEGDKIDEQTINNG